MRLVDIDDIRVMKFLSEEDDPSESDGEREYRNGWNDAITAINDIQPSAEPEETLEEAEEGIDAAFKKLRDARVTVLPSAEPEISRIEKELHGKTPEEQYEFIYWLLFKSFEATAYSNSRLAIIDWLRGEKEDE